MNGSNSVQLIYEPNSNARLFIFRLDSTRQKKFGLDCEKPELDSARFELRSYCHALKYAKNTMSAAYVSQRSAPLLHCLSKGYLIWSQLQFTFYKIDGTFFSTHFMRYIEIICIYDWLLFYLVYSDMIYHWCGTTSYYLFLKLSHGSPSFCALQSL